LIIFFRHYNKWNWLSIGLIALLWTQCTQDAPRDNIFDPESDLYSQSGSITGTITGKYPPYTPVPNLKIDLMENNTHAFSDAIGEFEFSKLMPGSYSLTISGDHYVTRADSVTILPGQETEWLVRMNGEPLITQVELITKHVAHWQPSEDEYVLEAVATISDLDGELDIDSVQFQIPGWSFDTLLTNRVSGGVFAGTFFNDAFGLNAFPELEGESIRLRCIDKSGDWGEWYQTQISRLIVSVPQTLSPAGLAVVDSLPTFRWSHFDAGFQVNYQVDVFRLDESAIPQFVFASPVMADTTLQWQSPSDLANARYYWTLSVIDRYENVSVSKEAAFMVQ